MASDKDVFLSHSGKQKNFVRQLHRDLTREHVSCFFDEDPKSLPLAEKFPSRIFKAAETCKIAVVVLSNEFIRSKWPMQELSAFVKAMKSEKNANLKLLPIFFMVSPKELSHITKDSPEWQKLEVSNETRGEWQDALKVVRSINGLNFGEDGDELDLRDKVVKEICGFLREINPPILLEFEPVGIENQALEVEALLDMKGTESALAVVVYGYGGVGKSTLAASVVQSLDWSSTDFKFCRVAIDEKTPDKTSHIINLQKHILYVLGGAEVPLGDTLDGQHKIKQVLEDKCCLLFIDNVVDKDYIKALLPQNFLFPPHQKIKLRIIITSRENNLNAELKMRKIISKEYEVKCLSDAASKHLLVETILQRQVVENIYLFEEEERMINEVAAECRGVPLLLFVFGKHLSVERNKESYEEALDVLREGNLDSYWDEDLGKRLMFVYNKIKDVEVKEAFLDICIYFHGWEWNLVIDIVDSRQLKDLHSRALVSRSSSGEVIVHDILRFMGMKEARLTRFSNYKELSVALEHSLVGFENVKGISLLNDNHLITIKSTQLEAMHQSLRVLMLGDWVRLDGPPCDRAFRNLRCLRVGDITFFPFKDPSKLDKLRVFLNRSKPGMDLCHLPSSLKRISHDVPHVECDKFVELPFQNLKSLKTFIVKTQKSVELPNEVHFPVSLVDLNINRCKNLPKDISRLTALESLILDRSDLERLPQGFAKLKKLKLLSMDYCSKLAFLSEELGMLSSLETLSMKGCRNLRALPESLGGLLSLQTFELSECIKLQELPKSFGKLPIQSLNLHLLVNLIGFPNSFGNMTSLKDLSLESCHSLVSLPNSFVQLKMLETLKIVKCSKLSLVLQDFGRLRCLKRLTVEECHLVKELPESFGELCIQSQNVHLLADLNELPYRFGNMTLLKDLSLESCHSLMSLPNSFVQLKMLETLKIINCTKLSLLPEDFGRLRCLKNMTVEECHLLKELPHGFGALPALKIFTLGECNGFVNLPRDFGELTSLEELYLGDLPLMSRIPDGFGKLKNLRFLFVSSCFQLKTLSDDFENLETLERLTIEGSPKLDGAMMEKILKLPNCYKARIYGSRQLLEKWEHMQGETDHPIVVVKGLGQRDTEENRALRAALLRGKCMEVKNGSDQLMERSSLLVGSELEEGTSVTVAVIMLPIHMQSRQHQTLQRFVEMAKETAENNGLGKLQIVCARKVELDSEGPTTTEEEERAEKEGIRQILLSLPKGSCAILSSECKRVKILTYSLDRHDCVGPTGPFLSNVSFLLSFFIANVGVDIEGRKTFESLKFIEDEISGNVIPPSPSPPPAELWKAENKQMRIIQNFIKSICPEHEYEDWDVAETYRQCQSESKTRKFVEALKGSGIQYLLINYNTSKMLVDDLHGNAIGFFICNFEIFECIKLHQIYEDLQKKDSNFIWIWIPIVSSKHCGHGSYTRFIQCMPWATFPEPQLVNVEDREPCFVLLDKHGQIANHDALPLLLAWGVKSYPFTPHTIPESLSLMESGSCLEFLLHGMNIVGRKQMKRKMTFLYVGDPLKWLQKKSMLEVLTQINGSFEVLYVGKFYKWGIFGTENVKQEYENATQNMRWPSLSFSDMIKFWYRSQYLANEEAYLLYKDSNIMMESLHGLANHLCGQWDYDDTEWVVLGDNNGVVTCDGYEVVQMICESSDEIWEGDGMGMRMVKDELILSLSRGECSPLVRTIFRDEIHNYPQHPQHPIVYLEWEGGCLECDVCGGLCIQKRTYCCGKCSWFMCGSCWMAYAKQQVQQMLRAKEN